MKKITLSILTIALALSASAQKLDRSIRPKAGPAPEIKLGDAATFTLPNGLKVFVVSKHKLPVVTCSIQLDIKPELEGSTAGVRDMMSDLLTSGTKTRSMEQLNKEIDYIGANISASSDNLNGTSLKKHFLKTMELMSDIAINSDFKQTELDKIKKRTMSGLEAGKNEPDAMLQNVSAVVNFGTQHPYGEVTTETTVSKITLAECKKYYDTYFHPNVAYMALVGDIDEAEAKELVTKFFGKWEKANVPVAQYSNPAAPTSTNVAFVPREGAVQSVINVTYPIDLVPGTADVIKARVTNSILGGGSNGRLFLNLREKHGWTYGSYSSVVPDELKGHFTAYAKCRNVVSDSSVGEIIAEMKKLSSEKVPQDELQNHLNNMAGTFAMSLENPQTIAQYAINIERYHMPKDYYKNYLKNLNAVTTDDVLTIAKKYIDPAHANIVVVGSKGDVDKTLTRFDADGKLDYYDNYGHIIIPGEAKSVPANITVDAVMKKYIAAIGGEKAVKGIKSIKTVSKSKINNGGQEMTLTITEEKANGKFKSQVEMAGMTYQKQVFNGTKGYQEQMGQKKEMDAGDIASAKNEADIVANANYEKDGIKRTLKGMDKVGDADAYVIECVDAKGKKSTEYYDAKTGFLVKNLHVEEGQGQTFTVTEEYSNYKEVPGGNGFKKAYTITQSAAGQGMTANIESIEVNKPIPDSEFN